MLRELVAACAIGFAWSGPALADAGPPTEPWDLRKAEAWSNFCLSAATGDAMGMRVFVRPPGAKPRIVSQVAEGAPMAPSATISTLDGKAVTFTVEATGEVFTGLFAGDTLTLRSKRLAKAPLVLHRRDDAKGLPTCQAGEGRS